MLFRALILGALGTALGAVSSAPAAAQTRTDAVRGRITTDSGKAVTDAEVVVTMAPTRVTVSAKTDSAGGYSLKLANGTGEYLLFISAVGRLPFRQRLTASGGDTTFVVDARLAPVPAAN